MRIALVAPLVSTIAQPYVGGAQAVLADLAYGLRRAGHDVTLFARAGSSLPGILIEELVVPESVRPADFSQRASSSSRGCQVRFVSLFRPAEKLKDCPAGKRTDRIGIGLMYPLGFGFEY